MGVAGELHIGGVGLARGYWNRPELTARTFLAGLLANPEVRFYRTGDGARYLPDGSIEYLGRLDNQVKIRGYRVEPGEVEAVLIQHPEMREAVVVARDDGAAEIRILAYFVPSRMPGPASDELRRFTQARLPGPMIPSAFMTLPALPLTPNGKIDSRALPEPDSRPRLEREYVAPRTPLEEALAGIWADILGLEQVGVLDNFFDLGGHSLLATQLVSLIRDTLKIEVPLREMFEVPTVAALADALLAADPEGRLETSANLVLSVAALSDDEAKDMIGEN
jgi:acyl carrier protein